MEYQVGKNIRILRKKRQIHQEDLAETLGVTVQAISKWEAGKANPDLMLLPRLAEYFGVTIDSLFFMNESANSLTEAQTDQSEQNFKVREAVAQEQMPMPFLPSWGFFTPTEEKLCLLGDVRGKTILEISCANGKSLAWLGEKGAKELWGTEISAGLIRQAKKLFEQKNLKAKLFVSPMELDPGLPHGYFDLVICHDCIGWSVDLDKTIMRAAEYLKSGGRFIFSWDNPLMKCIDSENGQYILTQSYLEERDIELYKFNQTFYMHHWKLSTYINSLANHGFHVERMIEESEYDEKEAEIFREGMYFSADRAKLINPKFIIKARKL